VLNYWRNCFLNCSSAVELHVCPWEGGHVHRHLLYLRKLARGEQALKPFMVCTYVMTRKSYRKRERILFWDRISILNFTYTWGYLLKFTTAHWAHRWWPGSYGMSGIRLLLTSKVELVYWILHICEATCWSLLQYYSLNFATSCLLKITCYLN
jgi:hypothetical protein